MNKIAETELILTSENKIYHLGLSKDEIADNIILVGDPGRVEQVSSKFDSIKHKISNREFITHTGIFKGKKLSVISTGIGTDNIDIVINELDSLANINFKTRTINTNKKSLNLIRLGTSGALQKDIEIDSFLVSNYALGFDGLAHFYSDNSMVDQKIGDIFKAHAFWPNELANPYCIKASKDLLNKFSDINGGITATASGFYGPQNRTLRLNSFIPDLHDKMESFNYNGNRITNFEMETSALYYLGQTLGHNTLTICAVIGNRLTKKYSKDYKKTISEMIDLVINRIY